MGGERNKPETEPAAAPQEHPAKPAPVPQTAPTPPFFGHAVLSRHGGMLAAAARQRAVERCKEKGFWPLRFLFSFQAMCVMDRLRRKEAAHSDALIGLAKKSVALVWGISPDRL